MIPNLIRFQQIRKIRNLATGEKFYRAVLINVEYLHKRTLKRQFRSASLAELYAYAVASRISRWLAATAE